MIDENDPRVQAEIKRLNEAAEKVRRSSKPPTSFMQPYTPMATLIPENSVGKAEIKHVSMSEEQAKVALIRSAMNPHRKEYGELIRAGDTFCRLTLDGQLLMSDFPMEQVTCMEAVSNARGDVLVGGLGIGMVLVPLLRNDRVDSVTVVENSEDVIGAVYPYIPDPDFKLNIIHTDLLAWKPRGKMWDYVWLDIWPTISESNWPQMTTLHRRFAQHLKPEGKYASWRSEDCQKMHNDTVAHRLRYS